MQTRTLPDVGSVKELLERGAAKASDLLDGAPIDALHIGHQAASKAIGQLPIQASDINHLRQRTADSVHHIAQTLDGQASRRLTPPGTSRARWKRPVFGFLLAAAGGAAFLAKRSASRSESLGGPVDHTTEVKNEAPETAPSQNGSTSNAAKPKAVAPTNNGAERSPSAAKKAASTSNGTA
jgi:hypothetical protein